MKLTIMYMVGIALSATPHVARALGYDPSFGATAGATVAGVSLLLVTTLVLVFARLYRRTKASEAFVRTGAGGVRVIRDGGALVIPVLHELVAVGLQTIKLEVERRNEEALITLDKLRADISAEFFVRVQPDDESILQASRSLGERMSSAGSVKELIEDKLVSALRTAAAGKTLEQLNSERDAFLADVIKLVADDLQSNGLVLETATISKLDQTDEQFLKAENIFDAQGRRKIAEITQQNLTERNRLVREGEELRKRQDVSTRSLVLEHELTEQRAQAEQRARVAEVEAEAQRLTEEKRILAHKQIELALREQQKAVEVAERQKLEAIAEAEQRRAVAEAELELRRADLERAHQQVETVRVTETAERDKRKQVIDAEASAEQKYLTEQRRADGEAYAREKQADAQRTAASAEASALRTRAEAEAEAEERRAQGERARAMVPVEVERAKVAIERDRVDNVIKPELEARELHGKVAQEFELAKLRIEAEREVRVAIANASATLFTKVSANLYGTPADVAKLSEAFLQGQHAAATANGFFEIASSATHGAVGKLGESAQELVSALSARLAAPELAIMTDLGKPQATESNGRGTSSE